MFHLLQFLLLLHSVIVKVRFVSPRKAVQKRDFHVMIKEKSDYYANINKLLFY